MRVNFGSRQTSRSARFRSELYDLSPPPPVAWRAEPRARWRGVFIFRESRYALDLQLEPGRSISMPLADLGRWRDHLLRGDGDVPEVILTLRWDALRRAF